MADTKVVFVIPFNENLGNKYKIGQEIHVGEFNRDFGNLKIPTVTGDKVYFYLQFNDGYVLRKSVKYYEVVDDPLKDNNYPVMWLYNHLDAKIYKSVEQFLKKPDHSSPYELFQILKNNNFNYSTAIDLREGDYIGLQRHFSKTEMTKYGKYQGSLRKAQHIYETSLKVQDGKLKDVDIHPVIPQLVSKVVRNTNKTQYKSGKIYYEHLFPLTSKTPSDGKYRWDENSFMDYFNVDLPGFYPEATTIMIAPGKDVPEYYVYSLAIEDDKDKVLFYRIPYHNIAVSIWSFDTYNINDEALIDDLEDDKLTLAILEEAFQLDDSVKMNVGDYIMLMDGEGYLFYGRVRDDISIEYLKDLNVNKEFENASLIKNINRSEAPTVDITTPTKTERVKKNVKFTEGTKPGSRQKEEIADTGVAGAEVAGGTDVGDTEAMILKYPFLDPDFAEFGTAAEPMTHKYDFGNKNFEDLVEDYPRPELQGLDFEGDTINPMVEKLNKKVLTEKQTAQVINSLKYDDKLKFDGVTKFSLRGSYFDGRKRKTLIIPYAHRYNDIEDDLYLVDDEVEAETKEAIKVLESMNYDLVDSNEFYYKKPLDYINYLEY